MYQKRGFTLIELLVVVLIIGILAVVALPQYQKAVYKSRMTEGFLVMRSIVTAEEAYYMANGIYTGNFEDLDIQYPESDHFAVQFIATGGNRYAGLSLDFTFAPVSLEYTLHSVNSGNIGKYYCRAPLNDATAGKLCAGLGKFSHQNSTTVYYLISGGQG